MLMEDFGKCEGSILYAAYAGVDIVFFDISFKNQHQPWKSTFHVSCVSVIEEGAATETFLNPIALEIVKMIRLAPTISCELQRLEKHSIVITRKIVGIKCTYIA